LRQIWSDDEFKWSPNTLVEQGVDGIIATNTNGCLVMLFLGHQFWKNEAGWAERRATFVTLDSCG